jgi:HK97 family phage portal protein
VNEIGQVLWSLLLRGNAYLLVTSLDWTGYPATFVVLNPDAVIVERVPDGRGVQYRWRTADGSERTLVNPHADELLHVKWQIPPGSFLGLGILDANAGPASTLAGIASTEAFAAELMGNPVPPAVLQHPLRLNKEQAAALQTQWAESVARARSVPAVLSGGITYTPLQITPRDVELIEARRLNATSVAVMFGLPPMYLGGSIGDSLTYSTTEGEFSRLWTMALSPAARRLELALGAWLPANHRLRFNADAVLRPLTLDRYNAHKVGIEAGFLTVDEARSLENRAPLGAPPAADTPAPTPLELPGPSAELDLEGALP